MKLLFAHIITQWTATITIVLLLVSLIFFFKKGRMKAVSLAFKGFLDSVEKNDFEGIGKRSLPYVSLQKTPPPVEIIGSVIYLKRYFKWGTFLPVRVQIKITNISSPIKGIEAFLLDETKNTQLYERQSIVKFIRTSGKPTFSYKMSLNFDAVDSSIEELQKIDIDIKVDVSARRLFFIHSEVSTKKTYSFYTNKGLTKTWVAFDPGTTGSCIVTGKNTDNIFVENVDGREKITPSVIAFELSSEVADKKHLKLNQNYYVGNRASSFAGNNDIKAFKSVKKLLGFSDKQRVGFVNGNSLDFTGTELSSLIVNNIYNDLSTFIEKDTVKFKELLNEKSKFAPTRAVVAIPNNFTDRKIKDMISCVRTLPHIREVRYVSEAEAILCYYIYQHHNLHPTDRDGLKDETVLVFDMGGATINATMADVVANLDGNEISNYDVHVESRIGYGIGGDTIDYCLLKYLFSFSKQYPNMQIIDPFQSTSNDREIRQFKEKLSREILDLKIKIIRQYNNPITRSDGKKELLTVGDIEQFFQKIGIAVKLENGDRLHFGFISNAFGEYPVFKSDIFQNIIYNSVKDAVKDSISLSYGNGRFLDTVIFSGRSVEFPGVKDAVIQVIEEIKKPQNEIIFISLKAEDLKTAVAKGACWYGINRNIVDLSPKAIMGYYGVKKKLSAQNISFICLLKHGQKFDEDEEGIYTEGTESDMNDSFNHDQHQVNFYRVNGANPQEILKNNEKHKLDKLASIDVDSYVRRLGMQVSENDVVSCYVDVGSSRIEQSHKELDEQLIADANEEHYTWIL